MLKVRTTERRTFKRCRRKWQYSYVEGLEPIRRSSPLWVGTAVHNGLEAYYLQHPPDPARAMEAINRFFFMERQRLGYNQMDGADRDAFNEDAELALGMLNHYLKWAPKYDDFEVVETEFYAEVPLAKGIRLTLRADGLLIDKSNDAWLFEHKTTAQIDQEAAWLELDDQASTYTWMFGQLAEGKGWVLRDGKLVPIAQVGPPPQIRGMLYNFLLKQVPHEPIVNKDGTLSVASKNLTCTAEDYEAAFKGSPGQGDAKYEDFIQKLRAKKWFHRLKVYRSSAEMDRFMPAVEAEISEMEEARARPILAYRNPTKDCQWDCAFMVMCKGELEGLDMEAEREEKFIVEKQLELLEVE